MELVEQYVFELYNKRQIELVHELCADPVLRHEAGNVVALSRNQQVERIRADLASNQPHFEVVNLSGDKDFATLTWNAIRSSTNRHRIHTRRPRFSCGGGCETPAQCS
ncbi:hypothetical protein ACFVKB_32460 [Rhodococcus sp. NPDC127530]|uniref:hypothetical protein n=1 Tax=unclassified Rhodococcus (in: high G+C Gram-positive bacteria) TaxID=192944 RepID=UPI003632735B